MGARLSGIYRLTPGLLCITTVVNLAAAQAPAAPTVQNQESAAPDPKSKSSKHSGSGRSWRVSPSFQVDAEYDDNVFLLGAGKKDNVEAPSSAEAISGRYTDMKSAGDVLTRMSAGFALKGPGFMGKTSVIEPEVSYELYTQNTARSNVILGLSIEQEAWARGRLRVRGQLTPSYFARNYLADAVDLDTDGSITDAERIYARGEYREGELGADYRVPLARSSKRHPFGASLQLGAGYYGRSFDAPLEGRNLHGPSAGAKLLLDLGRRMGLDVGYDYASLGSDISDQVLLLNESDFGQDLNGNGSNSDLDARVLTPVDRSRKEHSLGATLHLEPSKPFDVVLSFEHRWRRYTSEQPLDVANRGRRDARNQLSGDIRYQLTKDLRLRVGGIHSSQNLNRTGDPGSAGEIDDYTRSQVRLGLNYQL